MSTGKKTATKKKFNKKLFNILKVGVFLSTLILIIVSWIFSKEISIFLVGIQLLIQVLEFIKN